MDIKYLPPLANLFVYLYLGSGVVFIFFTFLVGIVYGNAVLITALILFLTIPLILFSAQIFLIISFYKRRGFIPTLTIILSLIMIVLALPFLDHNLKVIKGIDYQFSYFSTNHTLEFLSAITYIAYQIIVPIIFSVYIIFNYHYFKNTQSTYNQPSVDNFWPTLAVTGKATAILTVVIFLLSLAIQVLSSNDVTGISRGFGSIFFLIFPLVGLITWGNIYIAKMKDVLNINIVLGMGLFTITSILLSMIISYIIFHLHI